ncbi:MULTISPECIES: general stress protein [Pseudofrankia]|uniref:general stress protein n=1 Tax=Pseudofrankia TaxID=2994363 RepID=UPI000AD0158D
MGWREFLGLREPRHPHEQDYDQHDRGRERSDDDRGRREDHAPPEEPAHEGGGGYSENDVRVPGRDVRVEDSEYPGEREHLGELEYRDERELQDERGFQDQRGLENATDVEFPRTRPLESGQDLPAGFEVFEAPVERLGDFGGADQVSDTEVRATEVSDSEVSVIGVGNAEQAVDQWPTGDQPPAGLAGRASDLGRERGERYAVHRDRYQEFLAAEAEREEAARAEASRPASPAARPARPAPGAKPAGKRREPRPAAGQGPTPTDRRDARSARDVGREGDGQARLASGGGSPASHPDDGAFGAKPGQELSWRFPPQQVVASYQTHDQAERAVDYLADARFPVERSAIVGRNLTNVETIGRMSWWDSTLRLVGGWAVAGALVGWIFGLLDWVSPLRTAFSLALWGLLFGAVLGLFAGLLSRALAGGRRQRVTHSHVYRADSYDLLVDSELAERARSTLVLGGFPVTGAVRKDAISFHHR